MAVVVVCSDDEVAALSGSSVAAGRRPEHVVVELVSDRKLKIQRRYSDISAVKSSVQLYRRKRRSCRCCCLVLGIEVGRGCSDDSCFCGLLSRLRYRLDKLGKRIPGFLAGALVFFRIIQAQEQCRDYQHCSCCDKQYSEFIHLLFSWVRIRLRRA